VKAGQIVDAPAGREAGHKAERNRGNPQHVIQPRVVTPLPPGP
jgi:hypothetical protein